MRSTQNSRAELILRVQSSLTDRDYVLLEWLYDHGLLTTPQINAALFGSRRFCQRRLLTLTRHRAITRFRPFKLDGGTYPYYYLIDQLGADLIAAQRGENMPRPDAARQRRIHLTSRANLPHLLGVNQFFIDLAAHARTHPPAQLRQWWPASRFRDRAWVLDFTGDRGAVLRETPLPDGYGLWAQDGTVVAFFLEFDRGTETLGVLAGKVRRYASLEYEVPVLFLLPSAERELNLHIALSQRLPNLTAMVATTAQDILTHCAPGPAGPVWWLHGHQGPRLRLADLPPSPEHLTHLSAVSRTTATTQRA
ncbi:MAG TPA: replication-relaxation family protein [Candidatus Limnocylindrales bacterium]|nr:replication-relaxation family protein [Candidatus Limnocylindrales bacterium]